MHTLARPTDSSCCSILTISRGVVKSLNIKGTMVNSRLCFCVATFFCVLCFLLYNERDTVTTFCYNHQVETYKNESSFIRQPKTILLWTRFFGRRTWDLPGDTVNETYFWTKSCPESNCLITNDENFFGSVSSFDALLFHAGRPFLKSHPGKRAPQQVYVFVNLESPANTEHNFTTEMDFYNWTLTYRFDADIFWPYGYVQDVETGEVVAPKKQPIWRDPIFEFQLDDNTERQIAGKNKMAAWFVSHCRTVSKRENLVKILRTYIKVDIYGLCGPLRCRRHSNECDEKLDNEYKFYLSFENSLCVDYVTEKFFGMLNRNVVPVVFGGADYRKFAPPHSYINVEDFKTVSDLADYLIYLDENPTEYRKYFWWKKYYKQSYLQTFCDLCARLNNPSDQSVTRYIKDIKKWWYDNQCRSTNISLVPSR